MPVAPVVTCVILVSAVLIHRVGVEEAAPTVLVAGCALIVVSPDALDIEPSLFFQVNV
jgi:hypothetical protein